MFNDLAYLWDKHVGKAIGVCDSCRCDVTENEDFVEVNNLMYHYDRICFGSLKSEFSEDLK